MPSPTSTTSRRWRVSVVASNDAIWLLMMLMISFGPDGHGVVRRGGG